MTWIDDVVRKAKHARQQKAAGRARRAQIGRIEPRIKYPELNVASGKHRMPCTYRRWEEK